MRNLQPMFIKACCILFFAVVSCFETPVEHGLSLARKVLRNQVENSFYQNYILDLIYHSHDVGAPSPSREVSLVAERLKKFVSDLQDYILPWRFQFVSFQREIQALQDIFDDIIGLYKFLRRPLALLTNQLIHAHTLFDTMKKGSAYMTYGDPFNNKYCRVFGDITEIRVLAIGMLNDSGEPNFSLSNYGERVHTLATRLESLKVTLNALNPLGREDFMEIWSELLRAENNIRLLALHPTSHTENPAPFHLPQLADFEFERV